MLPKAQTWRSFSFVCSIGTFVDQKLKDDVFVSNLFLDGLPAQTDAALVQVKYPEVVTLNF